MSSKEKFVVASAVEEEEPVDPKEEIEAACMETSECKPIKSKFDACAERVSKDPESGENCVEVRILFKFTNFIGIFRFNALC
jgi:hypothetical protein